MLHPFTLLALLSIGLNALTGSVAGGGTAMRRMPQMRVATASEPQHPAVRRAAGSYLPLGPGYRLMIDNRSSTPIQGVRISKDRGAVPFAVTSRFHNPPQGAAVIDQRLYAHHAGSAVFGERDFTRGYEALVRNNCLFDIVIEGSAFKQLVLTNQDFCRPLKLTITDAHWANSPSAPVAAQPPAPAPIAAPSGPAGDGWYVFYPYGNGLVIEGPFSEGKCAEYREVLERSSMRVDASVCSRAPSPVGWYLYWMERPAALHWKGPFRDEGACGAEDHALAMDSMGMVDSECRRLVGR